MAIFRAIRRPYSGTAPLWLFCPAASRQHAGTARCVIDCGTERIRSPMPLKLRDYQPDAANESNLEYRAVPGYPVFVKWAADDAEGNPVTLSVGFPFIVSPRINATLRATREELEAAAN